MNSNRKAATIAGSLYIIGMVAGLLSVVSVVDNPDFMIKVSANENQVLRGAFSQFIMVPAYVGIALSLYPILRKYDEGLALGFVGFRIIAGVFNIIGVIILLLILTVSQEFANAGSPDPSYFQTIGGLLRSARDMVNHVGMILALSFGGLMYYYILYRTKLVPRWLSGWGFIGTALTMAASVLIMFRLIGIITPVYIVLNIPMALQEMVLAVWLIVKGFDPIVMDGR